MSVVSQVSTSRSRQEDGVWVGEQQPQRHPDRLAPAPGGRAQAGGYHDAIRLWKSAKSVDAATSAFREVLIASTYALGVRYLPPSPDPST